MQVVRKFFLASAVLAVTFGVFAAPPPTAADTAGKEAATQPATQPEIKQQYWFGVAVENIPPAISKHLRMKANQGLMVFAILPDSPAQKAGLLPDDILKEINGKPLTCQDDLFKAANAELTATGPKMSKLTFLRGGEERTVEILPAKRPPIMVVYNDKANPYTSYVSPSGPGAQVGPGIRIPLDTVEVKSIREIILQGQTVVLSQDQDASGNVRHRITVSKPNEVEKQYEVDPAHIEDLPVEIRPLAKKLVGESSEARLRRLELENKELKRKIDELAAKSGTRPN